MDNGNRGIGQSIEQWNQLEAPPYVPERKNLDPRLEQTNIEGDIEKKSESLIDKTNLIDRTESSKYDDRGVLGGVGFNAMNFLQQNSQTEQAPLGEIIDINGRSDGGENEIIGTDLPKAEDIDGLEPELVKVVDQVIKIKDPGEKYKKKRELSAKLLLDRYGRILGQDN